MLSWALLLFLAHPVAVYSFARTAALKSSTLSVPSTRQSVKIFFSSSEDAHDTSNHDIEEDEIPVKPYRNRSLAWTMRYRKLNPYDQARARVISFGHRSKEDWDEAVSSGQLGQYVPSYPDEMYAPEW